VSAPSVRCHGMRERRRREDCAEEAAAAARRNLNNNQLSGTLPSEVGELREVDML
jgi:hypothetical protein